MIAITSYTFESFGLSLPAAVVEIEEITNRKESSFYVNDPEEGSVQKNTLARIRVYADQSAYDSGKSPIERTEKYLDLQEIEITNLHGDALTILFPEGTIQ